MGIRYYAYAFDADRTEAALADPRSVIGDDPLADAWGMPHGAAMAVTNFEQSLPERDMVHLDKAWSPLQALTAARAPGGTPRPAHRMFEGRVTPNGYGWIPWMRALVPEEIAEIADDLVELQQVFDAGDPTKDDAEYISRFLDRAVRFTTEVARSKRGLVYYIG
ncbi:DUF1877 domain-containing protein [Rathayibacter sp. VKM Ac-2754]|nr:DUF1877 domain-containing protein [Rathayibacter sp. VKM Ac-2754]